ncbi:hypothetical protein ACFJGV_08710 [Cnuibacter sp. UC19_7]|uniref:hypothetical protein n=1 Tax=Cnuibacter sp. UC19_7 TaxID=3350166 RepID=UPI00366C747D
MSQQPWGTAPQPGPVPEPASGQAENIPVGEQGVPSQPERPGPPAYGHPGQPTPPYGHPSQPGQYTPPPYGQPGQPAPPPGYPCPGPPTPPPASGFNVLALVALLLAVVGAPTAFLPDVNFIGWLLLGISVVLSVVALALRGQKKGLAIASLSLSMAGALSSGVFWGLMAISDNAAPVESPISEQQSTLGSISDPLPLGSPIELEDWTYTILDVETDSGVVASEMDASGNYFETAEPGQRWVVMTYSITNKGEASAYPAEIVTAMVSPDDEDLGIDLPRYVLDDTSLLPAGESRVLSVAFLIPEGSDPLVRVTPSVFQDPVYLRF